MWHAEEREGGREGEEKGTRDREAEEMEGLEGWAPRVCLQGGRLFNVSRTAGISLLGW